MNLALLRVDWAGLAPVWGSQSGSTQLDGLAEPAWFCPMIHLPQGPGGWQWWKHGVQADKPGLI
jgi:hypothetical protein